MKTAQIRLKDSPAQHYEALLAEVWRQIEHWVLAIEADDDGLLLTPDSEDLLDVIACLTNALEAAAARQPLPTLEALHNAALAFGSTAVVDLNGDCIVKSRRGACPICDTESPVDRLVSEVATFEDLIEAQRRVREDDHA